MLKKKLTFKKINLKHLIAITILYISALLSVFVYKDCFIRLKESFRDIFYSLKYNLLYLLNSQIDFDVTVNNVSSVIIDFKFPLTFEAFKEKFSLFFKALFSADNFLYYLQDSSLKSLLYITLLEIFIILFFVIRNLILSFFEQTNNNYNEDTKYLTKYKRLEQAVKPIKVSVKDFICFFLKSDYFKVFLFIWLYNLNIYSIIIEFFAFYFYFIASFDVVNLYIQVYKLLFDLVLCYRALPFIVWLVLLIILILWYRRKKAFERLEHYERYDTGFIKSLPTVSVIYGLMGGGKGLVMTDMVLTQAKIFRENCKETMRKYELMFPNFPFINLENTLKYKIKTHSIYSLAKIEAYMNKRRILFNNAKALNKYESAIRYLFGYNYLIYSEEYDNNLYMVNIWEALQDYAMAYYIYTTIELNISNYAIRSDGIYCSQGNFPLWDYDFFNRQAKDLDKISTYGKILDQDIMRKGKKVVKDNKFSDTLEFGIVVMTELDKERGNKFVLNDMKRASEEANQKNDLFNYALKLDRHSSTVDYKHYMKIFFDLQRLGSTNSDLHECGQHLGIAGKDSGRLAMPFFFIEEFLYGILYGSFNKVYDTYRFNRGDNTLIMYLIKKHISKFFNYYENTYNLFGYDVYNILVESMTSQTQDTHKYYLMYKKAHSKRYCTDSFVDYFRNATLKCDLGMVDYPEYKNVKATKEEFSKQNSYFYMDLENLFNEDEEVILDKKE